MYIDKKRKPGRKTGLPFPIKVFWPADMASLFNIFGTG